ncbi:MAG TPA: hypothetical protein VKW06_00725 [Candidatus Angelobacter sp.]|nr:hypothetical protein [Candidatus Angelobacter sp.]
MKHEEFIKQVRDIVAAHVSDPSVRDRLLACKLVYGIGDGTYRGICYFGAWQNGHPTATELVEVAASGEESPVQLAGTTIHELGHVLAGHKAGHRKEWVKACAYLGLRAVKAAGTRYTLSHFSTSIRHEIAKLAKLSDGSPIFGAASNNYVGLPPMNLKPCPLGIGTRGGKSRGKGSGSRLRKFICGCEKPVIARVAAEEFKATCDVCQRQFHRAPDKTPSSEGVSVSVIHLVAAAAAGSAVAA